MFKKSNSLGFNETVSFNIVLSLPQIPSPTKKLFFAESNMICFDEFNVIFAACCACFLKLFFEKILYYFSTINNFF